MDEFASRGNGIATEASERRNDAVISMAYRTRVMAPAERARAELAAREGDPETI